MPPNSGTKVVYISIVGGSSPTPEILARYSHQFAFLQDSAHTVNKVIRLDRLDRAYVEGGVGVVISNGGDYWVNFQGQGP